MILPGALFWISQSIFMNFAGVFFIGITKQNVKRVFFRLQILSILTNSPTIIEREPFLFLTEIFQNFPEYFSDFCWGFSEISFDFSNLSGYFSDFWRILPEKGGKRIPRFPLFSNYAYCVQYVNSIVCNTSTLNSIVCNKCHEWQLHNEPQQSDGPLGGFYAPVLSIWIQLRFLYFYF